MSSRLVEEVKIHIDGRRETFECTLLAEDDLGAIVAWRTEGELRKSGFYFPANSVTTGFFWRWRRHNLYRFEGPDGGLIGHRIDIIEPARLGEDRIIYRDLLLDIVVPADSPATLEDEDELAEAVEAGFIGREDADELIEYAESLFGGYRQVLSEAESWLARYRNPSASSSKV